MSFSETLSVMPSEARLYLDALVFAFGACMGSFLNVCIHRIPLELSVIAPRSRCPTCMTPIAWYDNIPLLSYLALRARCRKCATRISPRYFVVELLVAVLFVLVWLKFAPAGEPRPLGLAPFADPWLVPVYWLAVFGLALGTFVDLEHMIIPDRVSLGGIAIGIVLSALLPSLHMQDTVSASLVQGLIGAVAGSGILWGVALLGKLLFRKDAMGMGDVKLLGAIGAFLGWPAVLFTIMASSLFGALVGVSLVLSGRKQMQSRIPYGPYLALAALIWMFWGPTLWDTYVNWLVPPLPADVPAGL